MDKIVYYPVALLLLSCVNIILYFIFGNELNLWAWGFITGIAFAQFALIIGYR